MRTAEARRIVAHQHLTIAHLKAAGDCSAGAESSLEIYLTALKLIEDHARKIREENRAKRGETRKGIVPRLSPTRDRELRRCSHRPAPQGKLQR
jgi:hypothetical protein